MIKNVRVTVDGQTYEVTVEVPDEMPPPPPISAPEPVAQPAVSAPQAAPAPEPSSAGASWQPGDVPSPLAGHVVGIAVTAGQQVKKGDNLVTVEAMKMNTFVLAPTDGKVAAVNVVVGDAVAAGQALVRIE